MYPDVPFSNFNQTSSDFTSPDSSGSNQIPFNQALSGSNQIPPEQSSLDANQDCITFKPSKFRENLPNYANYIFNKHILNNLLSYPELQEDIFQLFSKASLEDTEEFLFHLRKSHIFGNTSKDQDKEFLNFIRELSKAIVSNDKNKIRQFNLKLFQSKFLKTIQDSFFVFNLALLVFQLVNAFSFFLYFAQVSKEIEDSTMINNLRNPLENSKETSKTEIEASKNNIQSRGIYCVGDSTQAYFPRFLIFAGLVFSCFLIVLALKEKVVSFLSIKQVFAILCFFLAIFLPYYFFPFFSTLEMLKKITLK